MLKCTICGCEVEEEHVKHVEIKGNVKDICTGCIAAVKGLQ